MNDHEFNNEIISTIRQIVRKIDVQSKQLAKKYGLTGPQLIVLKELENSPGITSATLSKRINLTQATVTKILERLEKKDLITRSKSLSDKRKIELYNTDEAKIVLDKNPSFFQEEFLFKFAELQEWEKHLILSSLQRVASLMNADEYEVMPVLSTGPADKTVPEIMS